MMNGNPSHDVPGPPGQVMGGHVPKIIDRKLCKAIRIRDREDTNSFPPKTPDNRLQKAVRIRHMFKHLKCAYRIKLLCPTRKFLDRLSSHIKAFVSSDCGRRLIILKPHNPFLRETLPHHLHKDPCPTSNFQYSSRVFYPFQRFTKFPFVGHVVVIRLAEMLIQRFVPLQHGRIELEATRLATRQLQDRTLIRLPQACFYIKLC